MRQNLVNLHNLTEIETKLGIFQKVRQNENNKNNQSKIEIWWFKMRQNETSLENRHKQTANWEKWDVLKKEDKMRNSKSHWIGKKKNEKFKQSKTNFGKTRLINTI